jgi:hypothetical protein
MEASIIFHFAGRGNGVQRMALIDFAQLLDPKWRAPHELEEVKPLKTSFLQTFLSSAYNFVQGGEPTKLCVGFGCDLIFWQALLEASVQPSCTRLTWVRN